MLSVAPLDPDAPIPYVLTPLGKAECIVDRIRTWKNEEIARNEMWAFRLVCEHTFSREEVEAIFA